MSEFIPGFVSEFPDNPVTDCVPSSGLMLANFMTHGKYPASIAEREALQNAMGTQDMGANSAQLAAGMKRLFGLSVTVDAGNSALISALSDPTKATVLFGLYEQLPATWRQMGNQSGYKGGHAMYAQCDGNGKLIVGDPLASRFYFNVPIPDVIPFCKTFNYMSVIGKAQPYPVGLRAYVGPGTVPFWHVMRWTHVAYAPVRQTFSHQSWAPVVEGSKGFYMVTAGALKGLYAIAGRTPTLVVKTVWSDGRIV